MYNAVEYKIVEESPILCATNSNKMNHFYETDVSAPNSPLRSDYNWCRREETIFRKASELCKDFPGTEAFVVVIADGISDTFRSSKEAFEYLHSLVVSHISSRLLNNMTH
jgi:hypothetical protein